MTPPRLIEIDCPRCHHASWTIDSDYRGINGVMEPYVERIYSCKLCSTKGAGWTVLRQAPPEFLLQPHDLYPMSRSDFNYWVSILRVNFPDHPRLTALGATFYPRTPEEAAERKEAFNRAHLVAEMRDQDGARRQNPTFGDAKEWIDMMGIGDRLSFFWRDGTVLNIETTGDASFSVQCLRADGAVLQPLLPRCRGFFGARAR